MSTVNIEYAYNENNKIVHISETNENDLYFLDKTHKVKLITAKGSVLSWHFKRKYDGLHNWSNESINHYNAKMKILYDGFFIYYGVKIIPNKIIEEYHIKQINKRPDLVFFDNDDNILCCVEICNKNKKTKEDISIFKKHNLIVYEYDINEETTREISNTQRVSRLKSYIKEYDKRKETFKNECEKITNEVQERIRTSAEHSRNFEYAIKWFHDTIGLYQKQINDRG